MKRQAVDAVAIEAEVNLIRSLGIDGLRNRWRAMFGASPPETLTKDLIARIIAYRIQEEAFGGLSPALVKLLDRLAEGKKPDELQRRLKPGTVLIREYEGERHTVTVAADGFVWNGSTYASLSMIAHQITGTKWNGPRFFGLRVPDSTADKSGAQEKTKAAAPKRRSRSSIQASRG